MLAGSFSPAHGAPAGGLVGTELQEPDHHGGVLLELGVQKQHRDPSAPLLKGGKQKTSAESPRPRRCEPRLVNSCYQVNCLGRARILEDYYGPCLLSLSSRRF
jgi:hypothetical protein